MSEERQASWRSLRFIMIWWTLVLVFPQKTLLTNCECRCLWYVKIKIALQIISWMYAPIRLDWRAITWKRSSICRQPSRIAERWGAIKVVVIYRIILFIVFDSCCFSYRALQFSFYSTFVIQYPVKRLPVLLSVLLLLLLLIYFGRTVRDTTPWFQNKEKRKEMATRPITREHTCAVLFVDRI